MSPYSLITWIRWTPTWGWKGSRGVSLKPWALTVYLLCTFVFSPLRFWRWTVGHIGWRWFLLEMSHLPQWDASPFSKPTLVKSVGIHHGVDFCSLSLEWAQGGRWFLQNQNFRSAWLWLLWPENPSKVSVYCSSSTVYTFTVVPTDSDAEKSVFSPNPNLLTYVHYLILDFFDLK